jgi:ribosomal protein S27E
MTGPLATTYRAKLFTKNGASYFTMVYCPACNLQFRLLWPATILNYPEKAILHLKCPGCQHSFSSDQLAAGKLSHVGGNCERYPAAPVDIEPRTDITKSL